MSKRIYVKDYDWASIQEYYDQGHSWREVILNFNITSNSLNKGRKNGWFVARTPSDGMKLSIKAKPRLYSLETRQKMSISAKQRGLGGTRNSKKFKYLTIHGNEVILDSSYEVKVAETLDENNILWERPSRLNWVDDNSINHSYTADFYLPEYDVYLDPKHKGIIPLHARKIELVCEQNKVKVFVLTVDQLEWSTINKIITGL